MGDLTPNFSRSEFTKSATAEARGIENTVDGEDRARLLFLARALQVFRDLVGRAVHIVSGYANDALNKAIRADQIAWNKANPDNQKPLRSLKSDHALGVAADVRVEGLSGRDLALLFFALHHAGLIRVDKCIQYADAPDVVHVSIRADKARGRFLFSPKPGDYARWSP